MTVRIRDARGWYVIWPRELRSTRWWLFVVLGRVEVRVRRVCK